MHASKLRFKAVMHAWWRYRKDPSACDEERTEKTDNQNSFYLVTHALLNKQYSAQCYFSEFEAIR